jgi:hypothetical protein
MLDGDAVALEGVFGLYPLPDFLISILVLFGILDEPFDLVF